MKGLIFSVLLFFPLVTSAALVDIARRSPKKQPAQEMPIRLTHTNSRLGELVSKRLSSLEAITPEKLQLVDNILRNSRFFKRLSLRFDRACMDDKSDGTYIKQYRDYLYKEALFFVNSKIDRKQTNAKIGALRKHTSAWQKIEALLKTEEKDQKEFDNYVSELKQFPDLLHVVDVIFKEQKIKNLDDLLAYL